MPPKRNPSYKSYPRASSFYALSNCDVSFQLSQASGEEPPTPFSDRGTEVHAVIKGGIDLKKVDEVIKDEAESLTRLRNQRVMEWAVKKKPVTLVREKRTWLRKGMKPFYSGQPDEYVIQGRRAFLSDYKTSWHPLDDYTATNSQIRAYVPLVDADMKGEVDEITAAIHKPGKQSPLAVFDRDGIEEAHTWAVSVATTAMSKAEKRPNRGPWCKYCSGKVLCPLWREEMLSLSELSNAIVSEVPDSMLRNLAPRLSLAKEVAEKLLYRLYDRVKARPEFFSDWRFEPGQSRRKIDDTVEAYNALVIRNKILTPGEFLICCRIAVTDMETRIRKSQDLGIHDTHKLLAKLLEGIMEARRGKDVLLYDPKAVEGQQLLEDNKP